MENATLDTIVGGHCSVPIVLHSFPAAVVLCTNSSLELTYTVLSRTTSDMKASHHLCLSVVTRRTHVADITGTD